MTVKYLGVNVGFDFSQPLTAAGSSPGKTVELALTTDTLTRADAVAAVERFKAYLSNCPWPLS